MDTFYKRIREQVLNCFDKNVLVEICVDTMEYKKNENKISK